MKTENEPIQNEEENVVVEVKTFTTVSPKFSKEQWESGEGGGEGMPNDGDDK